MRRSFTFRCSVLFLAIGTILTTSALAAGAKLVVKLPPTIKATAAVAATLQLKLESKGVVQGQTITFNDLLPDTRYDVRIDLADGTTLQGVDMNWYNLEPAKADAGELEDEDRQAIKELFDGVKAFENKRNMLLLSGKQDRVVILAELIRDNEFHSAKGDEVIWRIEVWYYKNQHGGWEKVPQTNKVLRRERFTSKAEYDKKTKGIKWIVQLGGLVVAKGQDGKTVTLNAQ